MTLQQIPTLSAEHRTTLVAALLGDLDRWGAPDSAKRSAKRLAQEGSVAVVTGQQAGIAGGPLYTLYKAESAADHAARIQDQNPNVSVVPVFWIEGDDHDFEEVRQLGLFDQTGTFKKVRYGDDDNMLNQKRISIARKVVDPIAFEKFVEELFELLGSTSFTDVAKKRLRDAYLAPLSNGSDQSVTLVDGFARYLYQLLGDKTPVVLLSSHNPSLKRLASNQFVAAATNVEAHHQAVVEQTKVLKTAGEKTPITPRLGHLFIQHEGERLPLDVEGEIYKIRGTDVELSRKQVADIAREQPENLSPNVMLRPIVQDSILPTVMYVGGPTEVVYLKQLAGLYLAHGVKMPAVVRRDSKLIVEPKVERALQKSGRTLHELLAEDFDAPALLIDKDIDDQVEGVAAISRRELAAIFERLVELASSVDPSLKGAAGAAGARATKEVESTIGRIKGSLKKRLKTDIDRLESARNLVMPQGNPQERMIGAPYYQNRYGRIDDIKVEALPIQPEERQTE